MNLQPTPADLAAAEAFGIPLEHNHGSTRCCKPCRTASFLAGVLAERERAAGVANSYDDGSDDLQRGSDGGAIADDIRRGPQ